MRRIGFAVVVAAVAAGAAAAEKPTRFWNLTSGAVTSLRVSHAGKETYGDNLVAGDVDGVDHDERAVIANLPDEKYDLELKFKGGRVCLAHHVKIEPGKVFSVEDKDLISCAKR